MPLKREFSWVTGLWELTVAAQDETPGDTPLSSEKLDSRPMFLGCVWKVEMMMSM